MLDQAMVVIACDGCHCYLEIDGKMVESRVDEIDAIASAAGWKFWLGPDDEDSEMMHFCPQCR